MDQQAKNNALIDHMRELLCAPSDAVLARLLGVVPPVISKVRCGRLPVGAVLQLAMLDRGLRFHELREYVPCTRFDTPADE